METDEVVKETVLEGAVSGEVSEEVSEADGVVAEISETVAEAIGGPVEIVKPPGNKRMQIALAISVIAVLCLSAFIFHLINEKRDRIISENGISIDDRGALTWVAAFTGRDFNTCDLLVENQNFRLYSPLVVTQAQDRRYYERVLNGVVDCISDVSLLSVDGTDYKFQVRLKTVEPVESSAVVLKAEELRGSYLSGSMTDTVFSDSLKDIYFNAFLDTCFTLSDETKDFIVVLSNADVDGVVYVSGTVDFVDLVMSESGLVQNFNSFETAMKSEVDAVLKSGFDE